MVPPNRARPKAHLVNILSIQQLLSPNRSRPHAYHRHGPQKPNYNSKEITKQVQDAVKLNAESNQRVYCQYQTDAQQETCCPADLLLACEKGECLFRAHEQGYADDKEDL